MWALCIFLLIGKLATSISAVDPKVTHRIRQSCEEISQDIGRSVAGDFTRLARTGEEVQQFAGGFGKCTATAPVAVRIAQRGR